MIKTKNIKIHSIVISILIALHGCLLYSMDKGNILIPVVPARRAVQGLDTYLQALLVEKEQQKQAQLKRAREEERQSSKKRKTEEEQIKLAEPELVAQSALVELAVTTTTRSGLLVALFCSGQYTALEEMPPGESHAESILVKGEDQAEFSVESIKLLGLKFPKLKSIVITGNLNDNCLKKIAEQPFARRLTTLALCSTSVTAQGIVESMGSFSNLTSLSFKNSSLGDAGLHAIASQEFASQLSVLNLCNTAITVAGLAQNLPHFTALTQLNVSKNALGDEGLEAIARQEFASRLTWLGIMENRITAAGLARNLGVFTALTSLLIADNGPNLGDKGLLVIAQQSFAPSLIELALYNNGITATGLESVLDTFTNLIDMRIEKEVIDEKQLAIFEQRSQDSKQHCGHLVLDVCKLADFTAPLSTSKYTAITLTAERNRIITSPEIELLGRRFPALTSLTIRGGINDSSLRTLALQPCASRLTLLVLENHYVTLTGLADSLQAFSNLTSLTISRNCYGKGIGNAGLDLIARQSFSSRLRLLAVHNNDITGQGIKKSIGAFTNLRFLNCQDNKIGDQGLAELAKQRSIASRIEKLYIGNTGITLKSIKSSLPVFRSLIQLSIKNNDIGDGALEVINNQPFAFNLKNLDLSCTGITAQGVTRYTNRFTAVTSLIVANNNLGNAGIRALAAQPFAEQLNELDIAFTGMSVLGILSLDAFKNLRWLSLASNKIDFIGLELLARAPFASKLITLALLNAGITKVELVEHKAVLDELFSSLKNLLV